MADFQLQLHDAPRDGVTATSFAGDGKSLIVSSWDASLRVYDVDANVVRSQLLQPCPLLDCDFLPDGRHAASAGMDGAVRLHGVGSGGESVLGRHEAAVRCVRHCESVNALVSGSWDRDVRLWDVRSPQPCVGTYTQPDKVLSMCTGTNGAPSALGGAPLLVVATGGRCAAALAH